MINATQADRLPERVLITGGTGFIGTALARELLAAGVGVSVLSRNADRAARHFEHRVTAVESMAQIDAANAPGVIVNLAGKNLGEQRWNPRVKQQLVDSRVSTTQQVVDYIAHAEVKPVLLISGSAVGYYGARGDEALNEEAAPGNEFQSELCRRWEQTALQAGQYGVRICISRTGVVMGRGGGALSGLEPLFRKGLGAVAGNGKQWISWVHMQDLIGMFLRFMLDDALSGAFNNTSPHPVTNRQFAKTIGNVLQRPVLLRMPGRAMRLLYGEMAHLYVTGQKAIPTRHLQSGFDYQYPDIESALRDALQPIA
ncbi:MAG: TIGR01777 family oxidoreductase [Thiohalophilus sp.]